MKPFKWIASRELYEEEGQTLVEWRLGPAGKLLALALLVLWLAQRRKARP